MYNASYAHHWFGSPTCSLVPPTSCGHKASILCPGYFAANVEDFNLSYWEMLVLDPPEYRERSA